MQSCNTSLHYFYLVLTTSIWPFANYLCPVHLGYDHVVLLLVLLVPPRLGHLAPASEVVGGHTLPF
jgi:high-affinity K+ transport system ATPase subunit B